MRPTEDNGLRRFAADEADNWFVIAISNCGFFHS
jgi:hypothetical protein